MKPMNKIETPNDIYLRQLKRRLILRGIITTPHIEVDVSTRIEPNNIPYQVTRTTIGKFYDSSVLAGKNLTEYQADAFAFECAFKYGKFLKKE